MSRCKDNLADDDRGTVRLALISGRAKAASDRVALSSGLEWVESRARLSGPWVSQAIVPRSPWRRLEPADEARWISVFPLESSRSVSLVDLGEAILLPFKEAGLHEVHTEDEAFRLKLDPKVEQALGALRSHQRYLPELADSEPMVIRPPGLVGSTVDYRQDGRHIGLHVDSWEKEAMHRRHLMPSRVCVNLGPEARFFLFVPLTLQRVAELAEFEGSEVDGLLPAFMEKYPEMPVLRLKIEPGEAYIAPTENVFHDGSTEYRSTLDLTVTWRGTRNLASTPAHKE